MENNKFHYVVVTGMIIKEGKYLIVKRSDKEKVFPGKWTVPGGKLEQKDYINLPPNTKEGQWYNILDILLKREVKEEVNLDIKNIKYLTNLTFIRPDNIPVVVLSLFAYYENGEVKLNEEELSDHKWVTLEEAKEYDFIDGIYEELVMLDKHLKGEEIKEWQR